MTILSHGSDLRLAPTLRPLVVASGGSVRSALAQVVKLEFQAVQLDATLAGIRPRELSHRARRDLSALLSRSDIQLAGIDLFLPREHYIDAQHMDRAVAATIAAIELAADLGRVTVSISLPVAQVKADVKSAIVDAADGHGVRVAVHVEDQIDDLIKWLDEVDQQCLGAGIDPAAVLARGGKPVKVTNRLAKRLAGARLSDLTSGAVRCAVGEGELEVAGYRIALDLAAGRTGPVVLDLRGIENPMAAAASAKSAWEAATFTV
ncbi:MAG: TIM barrel protein [Phycisphaeraceae bacterium]